MAKSIAEIGLRASRDISADERARAKEVLRREKVAIFIVAYNAEKHLPSVIERIPGDIGPEFAEIFIIDDSSTDRTFEVANALRRKHSSLNLNVYRTPHNRGYGGNQKLGFLYCMEKSYDIVILLHGDGQYAPEYLPRVIAPFHDKNVDAVFASRMIDKAAALDGGMPFYKWIGNQILTSIENRLLGTGLSEFHTGFRAYRLTALKKIPFSHNSDQFHFDTEIIVQAVHLGWSIREVAVPTHYGDETCHVNGVQYAYNCFRSVVKYRLVNLGLYYERNYDFGLFEGPTYHFKKSAYSLHQFVLKNTRLDPGMVSIELGANRGILSNAVAKRVKHHTAVDIIEPDQCGNALPVVLDLNGEFSARLGLGKYDCCLVLDVIEHMNDPEGFLAEVFKILKKEGTLYLSTANICYLPMRISLLLGQFNYGKRGILDRTHTRLFSIRSLKKMLNHFDFKPRRVIGFAPPIVDLVSRHPLMVYLENIHAFLARVYPRFFAYNFLVEATRLDDLSDIFRQTLTPSSSASEARS